MMYVASVTMLTALIYTLFVLIDKKRKNNFEGSEVLAIEVNSEEFYKTLNFMLMYGIIDFQEYTKLELKSLPYLKG